MKNKLNLYGRGLSLQIAITTTCRYVTDMKTNEFC